MRSARRTALCCAAVCGPPSASIRTQQLRPRTVVDYDREAFVWQPGNIRVTLDSDIRAGLSPERFLSPGVPELTAAEAVLEVK